MDSPRWVVLFLTTSSLALTVGADMGDEPGIDALRIVVAVISVAAVGAVNTGEPDRLGHADSPSRHMNHRLYRGTGAVR